MFATNDSSSFSNKSRSFFFFSSRRRHTRFKCDWSSDVCSSDLRLDGPVRGNGRIIDELERLFAGAGWSVIKLVWGSDWDGLFARDTPGALARAFANTVDGQMQTFAAKDGRFNRDHFFNQNPELAS